MMRSVALIPCFVAFTWCAAQSGDAFLVQCGSAAEVQQKRTLAAAVAVDPKAVVSFNGADVKVRFPEQLDEASFVSFLQQAGLNECRARTIAFIGAGSGMVTGAEGTIGTGADQRRTVETGR